MRSVTFYTYAAIICGVVSSISSRKIIKSALHLQGRSLDGKLSTDASRNHITSALDIRTYADENMYFNPILRHHSAMEQLIRKGDDTSDESRKQQVRKTTQHGLISSNQRCSGLCEQSLCPWTMHWNRNTSRVPEYINYAKCKSRFCNFEFARLDLLSSFKLEMDTRCEEVTTEIFVTINGKERWLPNWPIACMCAKSRTTRSNSQGMEEKPNTQKTLQLPILKEIHTAVKKAGNGTNNDYFFTPEESSRSYTELNIHEKNFKSFEQLMRRRGSARGNNKVTKEILETLPGKENFAQKLRLEKEQTRRKKKKIDLPNW